MKMFLVQTLASSAALLIGCCVVWSNQANTESLEPSSVALTGQYENATGVQQAIALTDQTDPLDGVIRDDQIRLCQGFGYATGAPASQLQCGCQGTCSGACGGIAMAPMQGSEIQTGMPMATGGFGYGTRADFGQPKMMLGVNDSTARLPGHESRFRRGNSIDFDRFSYGGYIGPHRTPHVPEYRLRVNDQLEFVYIRTREKSLNPYKIYVGDILEITSSAPDGSLNQNNLVIRSDGMTSLTMIGQVMCAGKTVEDLQRELNDKYSKYIRNPQIIVQVRQGETPLQDIVDSVDARQGQGGQSRQATVAADGTIQLPAIGNVPAVGLSLNEIAREINARYRLRLGGITVTPILLEEAPRFIYVVGEVAQPNRYQLTGPTSALQALALAQGPNAGGNIRQIIVLRRDQNWRLSATKLDLAGALYGKRPQPSDEIWLQADDIVLVPKKPIQRLSEAVNQYLSNTLYQIFPQQGVAFNFDGFTPL